jgi:hypothetical protein
VCVDHDDSGDTDTITFRRIISSEITGHATPHSWLQSTYSFDLDGESSDMETDEVLFSHYKLCLK